MASGIFLEKRELGWVASTNIGDKVLESNPYFHKDNDAWGRGWALEEIRIAVKARVKFAQEGVLDKFISAYKSTPLFPNSGLSAISSDDETLNLLLRASVIDADTVASFILRGIIDAPADDRLRFVEQLAADDSSR